MINAIIISAGRGPTAPSRLKRFCRPRVHSPGHNPATRSRDKFKEAAELFHSLRCGARRRYDSFGHAASPIVERPGWGAQGFGGIEDFWETCSFAFFGGGWRGGRRSAAQRGRIAL